MTKTDFAELKEKLILNLTKSKYASVYYATYEATVSELIDIIKSQSEALEAQPRYDMSENPPRETYAFKAAQQALSETTTRLQKLRDGK